MAPFSRILQKFPQRIRSVLLSVFCIVLVILIKKLVLKHEKQTFGNLLDAEYLYMNEGNQDILDDYLATFDKDSFLKERQKIYEERRKTIAETCERIQKDDPNLFSSIEMPNGTGGLRLQSSLTYGLLWSKVAKVGTSSWRQNFRILKSSASEVYNTEKASFSWAKLGKKRLMAYWKEAREKGFLSFAFTRHPFTRLVAAYRGKLENKSRSWTSEAYHGVGREIVRKYRTDEDKKTLQREECTWEEFVRYLISETPTDHHWKPMTKLIYPCDLDYDVHGRLDSFTQDSWYIILKKNLQHLVHPLWVNNGSLGSEAPRYFKMLSKHLIRLLYQKYKSDFELFGYDHQEYLDYGIDEDK